MKHTRRSVFADTVENIGGEIHKNPWKPGNEQKPTSVKVTLKGTKTLNGSQRTRIFIDKRA